MMWIRVAGHKQVGYLNKIKLKASSLLHAGRVRNWVGFVENPSQPDIRFDLLWQSATVPKAWTSRGTRVQEAAATVAVDVRRLHAEGGCALRRQGSGVIDIRVREMGCYCWQRQSTGGEVGVMSGNNEGRGGTCRWLAGGGAARGIDSRGKRRKQGRRGGGFGCRVRKWGRERGGAGLR